MVLQNNFFSVKKSVTYFLISTIFFTNSSNCFAYSKYDLINAVKENDISSVRKMISNKYDLNVYDIHGNTALSYAIKSNNYIISKALIDAGADYNALDKNGKKIYCSAKTSQSDRIKRLFSDEVYVKCNSNLANNKINKPNAGMFDWFNWKIGTGMAVVAAAGLGLAGGGGDGGGGSGGGSGGGDDGGTSNKMSPADRLYGMVGNDFNEAALNNILSGTNVFGANYYSGYTYSVSFNGGAYTFSNFDDYNEIRLAYAWARGYTGKVNSSSYLSNSSGTPYYLSGATGTTSYSVGDSIKVAVIDQGVFSNNDFVKNNLASATGSIDSNQLYQYYLNNCVGNSCFVFTRDDYANYTNKYLKCSSSGSSLNCAIYDNSDATGIIAGSTFTITSNDTNPINSDSLHGTMVSGVIVANPISGDGMSGVAPEATVIPYTIGMAYDYELAGTSYEIQDFASNYYIGQAFKSAANNGVVAINNSWGSGHNSSIVNEATLTSYFGSSFLDSIKTAVASDVIFVWSAGNSGTSQPGAENSIPLYLTDGSGNLLFYDSSTGYYKNFITVAAYDTENNTIASWSDRCGVAENYCLTAPGSYILTTDDNSNEIVPVSGTSFSAPIVTAAVAVLKGAFPYLTGAEITKLLFITARDLGATGVDEVYGWGMLDLERATRPVGASLVPIDSNVDGRTYSLSASSINANSKIGSKIIDADLSFVMLDSFNRTFTLKLNDYVTTEKNRVDTIDILNKFKSNTNSIALNKNKSFNFYYSGDNVLSGNGAELSYSINDIEENTYGFSVYYGNNPYSAFENKKNDFYNLYSLANSYNYNVINPYFTTNSNNNIAFNNIFKINDKTNFNLGVVHQEYVMNYDKLYNNQKSDESFGTAFSVLSGVSHNFNNNISSTVEVGLLNEFDTLLGSKMNGAFGVGGNNLTYMASLKSDVQLFNNKVSLFGKMTYGYTSVNESRDSLIKDISTIYSNSFSLGLNYNFDSKFKNQKSNVSLLFFQPVQIKSGKINIELPFARDFTGNMYYNKYGISLKDQKDINVQLAYNYNVDNYNYFKIGCMYRDYLENELIFLMNYNKSFNFY